MLTCNARESEAKAQVLTASGVRKAPAIESSLDQNSGLSQIEMRHKACRYRHPTCAQFQRGLPVEQSNLRLIDTSLKCSALVFDIDKASVRTNTYNTLKQRFPSATTGDGQTYCTGNLVQHGSGRWNKHILLSYVNLIKTRPR